VLLAEIMKAAGEITFANLPLLFAIGVAMGLSQDSGVAGLSGAIGYLVMRAVAGLLTVSGITVDELGKSTFVPVDRLIDMPQAAFGTNLGIHSLEMGVFGGIAVGLLAAFLYNRFKDVQFPEAMSFFAGPRFIPIITSFSAIILGVIMAFI